MKKLMILLAPLLLLYTARAQELKEVTRRSSDGSNIEKETYHVLKSDRSIRNGEYRKYHNDQLLTAGFYANGKEDSTWMEYLGKKLVAVKYFRQGAPTGIWDFYDTKGNLESHFNWDLGAFTGAPPPDSSVHPIGLVPGAGDRLQEQALDRLPRRIMSTGEYMRHIMQGMRYPPAAIMSSEQGTVEVAITIDENGQATGYSIHQSVSSALDDEAIRVLKNIRCSYLPGILNGAKVKSVLLQKMIFRLGPRPA